VELRRLALRLRARGLSLREIGPQVSCWHQAVALIARQGTVQASWSSTTQCHRVLAESALPA
jgi:hypothetical protein